MSEANVPTLGYGRPFRPSRRWIVWTLVAMVIAAPLLFYWDTWTTWCQVHWQRWQYTRAFDRTCSFIPEGQWFADGANPQHQEELKRQLKELFAQLQDPSVPMTWIPKDPQVVAIAYDDNYGGKALCFMLIDGQSLGRCCISRDGQFRAVYQLAYRIEGNSGHWQPISVKLVRTTATQFPTVLASTVLIDGTENDIRWQAQANALDDRATLRFDMTPAPQAGTIDGEGHETWHPAYTKK